jgi:UDP-N-acetylglucosamine acyltransferase
VNKIHPTAIIDASALIGEGVSIGPYTVIGPGVEIGPGCQIDHHVNIERDTSLGEGCRVWPFASLGGDPQDLKYQGESTRLRVGKRNRFREFVTINRGSAGGGGLTSIGDDCLFMAYVHVAHDCHLGNRVIMANATNLAGHVAIEDYVGLGGMVVVHQFCRIGAYAFVGGASGVAQDLAPYMLYEGRRCRALSVNSVGLRRAGIGAEAVNALKQAHRILFRQEHSMPRALELVREQVPGLPEVRRVLDFIAASQRGVAR